MLKASPGCKVKQSKFRKCCQDNVLVKILMWHKQMEELMLEHGCASDIPLTASSLAHQTSSVSLPFPGIETSVTY